MAPDCQKAYTCEGNKWTINMWWSGEKSDWTTEAVGPREVRRREMEVRGKLYKEVKPSWRVKSIRWTEDWGGWRAGKDILVNAAEKVYCTCQSCLCSCTSSFSTTAIQTAMFIVCILCLSVFLWNFPVLDESG